MILPWQSWEEALWLNRNGGPTLFSKEFIRTNIFSEIWWTFWNETIITVYQVLIFNVQMAPFWKLPTPSGVARRLSPNWAMASNVSSNRFFRAESHTFSSRKSRFFGPKVTLFRAKNHAFSGRNILGRASRSHYNSKRSSSRWSSAENNPQQPHKNVELGPRSPKLGYTTDDFMR
jgi:hypothetical protein